VERWETGFEQARLGTEEGKSKWGGKETVIPGNSMMYEDKQVNLVRSAGKCNALANKTEDPLPIGE